MADKINIYAKLTEIQTQIKAPKNLYNSFGKYKYRNAESICEAVKPFLEKTKTTLLLKDDIEVIDGRFFMKCTATLVDNETCDMVETHAYAEMDSNHKGMSADQITGCCSSYCRKYCLNALLLLDDTKDADSEELKNEQDGRQKKAIEAHCCAKCGKKITPLQGKDGEMSVEAVEAYSLKKFGSVYCGDCQKFLYEKAKRIEAKKSEG